MVDVHQLLLTPTHLALCMDYASGGSLTSYVAERWQHADPSGLVMPEDEGRYFFKVGVAKHPAEPMTPDVYSSLTGVCFLQQFIAAIRYCHTHRIAHR